MSKWKKAVAIAGAVACALGAGIYVTYCGGQLEGRGTVSPRPVPSAAVAARAERQQQAASPSASASDNGEGTAQILFGDLHVHTTFSTDAFLISLPLLAGEGAHPPADACDFARYCSGLDFFAITDHAEALTPRRWSEIKQSVRECNAVADPAMPDLVAFTGFEWSQVGRTPEEHYGHKNVIYLGTAEDQLPKRAIASAGVVARAFNKSAGTVGAGTLLSIPILDFANRKRYQDFLAYYRELTALEDCPPGVGERDLPADCRDTAATPAELFDKLSQWGQPALVIPHGTTWGFYTPPGYSYDKQISAAQNDPERQRLIEVYSGHGNSEEHRRWRAWQRDGKGPLRCPEPTDGYEPCCWRAGEIIRSRCGPAAPEVCEKRVTEARRRYLAAGVAGHLTVPGTGVEDWRDCGQCRDCFDPSFNYRPGGSVQYILAKGGFADPKKPTYLTLGFIASSDNHKARPGTGYKEYARRKMTEATGARSEAWRERIFGKRGPPAPESVAVGPEALRTTPPFLLLHTERQASFFLTGGLVAVHARGRSREAIFKALHDRRVYGTSGPRILLWFNLLNAPGGSVPMGAEVKIGRAPRFEVRALGAFKQQPGCPGWSREALSPTRLEKLCAGECYHPGDERMRITRLELVRIRRQRRADEPIAKLIDDVLRRYDCPAGPGACATTFEDADFADAARDTLYYVRAIQEPTPAVNADSVRCQRGEQGKCVGVKPCYGDSRTPLDDDCLAPNEERAWSSPIYLHFDRSAAADDSDTEGASKEASDDVGK